MQHNTDIKHKKKVQFTIRIDPKTQEILEILQDKTLLSKAGVFRLALLNFYNQNVDRDSQIKKKMDKWRLI